MQKQSLNWKELSIIIILLTAILIISSCTTNRVVITDNRIMAYWVEAGERCPYNGVLLNKYTYDHLKTLAEGEIERNGKYNK